MSDPKIDSGLTKVYVDAGLGVPTLYPNSEFEPARDAPDGNWNAVFILPDDSQQASLGASGKDRESGTYQITLACKKYTGDGDILDRAKAIKTLYQQNRIINYDGARIHIGAITIQKGYISEDYYKVPVDIRYTSFLTRG